MKTKLLFGIAICLTISINSQNVWTGTVNDKWSDEDNWSGNVPTPTDDVLIPSGFTVTLDTPANIRSIEVQGNSTLNVTESLIIAVDSEFEDNVVVNWSSGDLSGPGVLLNSGTINLSFPSFDLGGSVVLNNPGTINLIGGATIFIGTDSVLNNSGTGVIDFQSDGVSITKAGSAPNVLNNYGTIKTSFLNPTDEGFIACQLINHDGIFQVDSGILSLNNTTVNLMNGQYNIFAGATLNWNSPTTVSGILSGNVFGDLNWNDDLIVATTAFFNFNGNQTINCTGNLEGGGTLTNQTTINQIGGSAMQINGQTTLVNDSLIQITSGPGIAIGTNSILNNNASGVIDIQSNGSDISLLGGAPNLLNNSGLIHVSFLNPTDQSIFSAQLNNNNGTINVDNGILWLFNSNTTLTNGNYNIASGGNLKWTLPITISGELNGNLEGILGWEGDLLVPTTASFNFIGNGNVEWKTNLLSGGGILTNEHIITTVNGANKIINGSTTLINNGEFNSSGFIRISTNSILTNSSTGVIDIKTLGSSFGTVNNEPHTFVNSGLLVASFSSNTTFISAPLNNFGTIEATSAEIDFSNTLINEASGVIRGSGTIDLPNPTNFINNGTFSPGLSPGTLSVMGNYSSTSSSVLDIEIDGLTQGTEYDLLAISGNADLNGDVQITLGFNPNVNDEFIVASISGSINTCNLPSTTMASFGGYDYEFSFNCVNNNELSLTVTSVLSTIDDQLSNISIYPNPTKDFINLENATIDRVYIFDINGRKILESTQNKISVQHLVNGVYFLRIEDENHHSATRKIIKH